MPQYEPPPPTLDHLNPIQRYMQKGSLDREDYIRLGIVVLAYFIARPWISKLMKWLFTPPEVTEGEATQKAYFERRDKAKVGPNAIRGTTNETIIPEDESSAEATTSGTSASKATGAVNRKSKPQSGKDLGSEEEKLLDWEDEEMKTLPVDNSSGDQADVMKWLDKWDK